MSSHAVPIIGLFGPAGSGKDTAGSYIKAVFGGVCVAQADPMKRFAQAVFGFTDEQLWGPSANRNAVDPRTVTDRLTISANFDRKDTNEVIDFVVPSPLRGKAISALSKWFDSVYHSLQNDIPISPRLVLQTLGTECGRQINKDIWSKYEIGTLEMLLGGGYDYSPTMGLTASAARGFDFGICTDGRFRNEAVNLRMAGGIAIKIERDTDTDAVEAAGVKNHVSEKELNSIPAHFFNQVIQNNGSIAELTQKIDGIMNYYYGV